MSSLDLEKPAVDERDKIPTPDPLFPGPEALNGMDTVSERKLLLKIDLHLLPIICLL